MAKRKVNPKTVTRSGAKQTPKKDSEYLEGKYWRGNVHISGVGVVNGPVRNDHLEKFKSSRNRLKLASKLSEQDQPDFDLNDWIKDVDLLEQKKQRDRKANKDRFK